MKDNFTPFDPIQVGDYHEIREHVNDLGRMILIPCASRGERNPLSYSQPKRPLLEIHATVLSEALEQIVTTKCM
jgi:hypothetical protein